LIVNIGFEGEILNEIVEILMKYSAKIGVNEELKKNVELSMECIKDYEPFVNFNK
jgi:hypothetical protein